MNIFGCCNESTNFTGKSEDNFMDMVKTFCKMNELTLVRSANSWRMSLGAINESTNLIGKLVDIIMD